MTYGVQWSTSNYAHSVETPGYLRAAELVFDEAEREWIVSMLAAHPECGEIIPGTGGFRKLRVARRGMGKRGGARLIYIERGSAFPVFLITVYAKNQKENLTHSERNLLAKRAIQIFSTYGR